MRRKHLAIIAIPYFLPLAEALSLANFQQITSILIPISCQLQYDSQIPTCTVSDFEEGCSISCQSALTSTANSVSSACVAVLANSKTLLGIVKAGGIIQALCPTETKVTTTLARPSTTPIAVSNSAPVAQTSTTAGLVTIPTASPGVTGGEGLNSKTSSTLIVQSASSPSKSASVKTTNAKTTSTTATTIAAASSSTIVQSADGGLGGSTTTTSTSLKKSATTTSATAQNTQQAQQTSKTGSGGGSPFDISSGTSRCEVGLSALVMVAWAVVLLGE